MSVLLILALLSSADKDELLAAIKQVESSGIKNVKDGDNGRSIGSYQIGRPYFKDAVKQDPSLGVYKYEDVRKDNVAVAVIRAYWAKYATRRRLGRDATAKDLARMHNGGLNGFKFQNKKKEAKLAKYWAKIKKEFSK